MIVVAENVPSTNLNISLTDFIPCSKSKDAFSEATAGCQSGCCRKRGFKICTKIKTARQSTSFNLLVKIFVNQKKMSDIIS